MASAIERDEIVDIDDLTAEDVLNEFESHILRPDDGPSNINLINESKVTNFEKEVADVRFERTISIRETESNVLLSWPEYTRDTIHINKKDRFNVVPNKVVERYKSIENGCPGWGNTGPVESIRYREKEGKKPITCSECNGQGCKVCDWSGDVVEVVNGLIEWYCNEKVYVNKNNNIDVSKVIGAPKMDIDVSGNVKKVIDVEPFLRDGVNEDEYDLNEREEVSKADNHNKKDTYEPDIGYPVVEAVVETKVPVAKLEYIHGGKSYNIFTYNEYMIFNNIPPANFVPNSRIGFALLLLLISLFLAGPFYPIIEIII